MQNWFEWQVQHLNGSSQWQNENIRTVYIKKTAVKNNLQLNLTELGKSIVICPTPFCLCSSVNISIIFVITLLILFKYSLKTQRHQNSFERKVWNQKPEKPIGGVQWNEQPNDTARWKETPYLQRKLAKQELAAVKGLLSAETVCIFTS